MENEQEYSDIINPREIYEHMGFDGMAPDIRIRFVEQELIKWKQLMTYYRCAIYEIETKFKVLNEQFSMQYDRNPIENIKTRLKNLNSIHQKLEDKNLDFTVENVENNIFDVAGIRVICSFPKDVYMLADCLLMQDDIVLIRKKDYIKKPKENGYRSLHLIVQIPIFLQHEKRIMNAEVQLRTIAMDFWASLEHKLRYKKDIEETTANCLSQELLECANMSAQLDRRMEGIRDRME